MGTFRGGREISSSPIGYTDRGRGATAPGSSHPLSFMNRHPSIARRRVPSADRAQALFACPGGGEACYSRVHRAARPGDTRIPNVSSVWKPPNFGLGRSLASGVPPGAPSACFLPTALGGASDGEPGSALFLSPRFRPLHPGKERQATATQQTATIIFPLSMPETLPGGTAEHSAFHRGANGIRKSCQRIARHTARKPAADNFDPCLTRLPMKRNGQTSPVRATVSHWKRACRNAPPGASSACFFSKALGRAFFMEHPTGAPFLLPSSRQLGPRAVLEKPLLQAISSSREGTHHGNKEQR